MIPAIEKLVFGRFGAAACGHAVASVFLSAAGLAAETADQDGKTLPVRVACVGDSITYGAGLRERDKLSYPALLQARLGAAYEVRNYGVSSATISRSGDQPYCKQNEFQAALEFKPDVVFIMLGASDEGQRKGQSIEKFGSELASDYTEIVDAFKKCASVPRVVAVTPVTGFRQNLDSRLLINRVICNAAFDNQIEPLDMRPPFDGYVDGVRSTVGTDKPGIFTKPTQTNPGIHSMNAEGGRIIAERLHEFLKTDLKNDDVVEQKLKALGIEPKVSNFFGYRSFGVTCGKARGEIVVPWRSAPQIEGFDARPWVFRSVFWGVAPGFDRSMLERGFYVVRCHGGAFGEPGMIASRNKFYELMLQVGLAKRGVVEGMSRGGMVLYNWASANPDKVLCIYGDAPVCDFRSWPGGRGKGKFEIRQWQACLGLYGLTEEEANKYDQMPIDRLAPLAAAGVKLISVCGMKDTVVPFEENTGIIEKRYKELGGDIVVIKKPDGGHSHGLTDPAPITNFALEACGRLRK